MGAGTSAEDGRRFEWKLGLDDADYRALARSAGRMRKRTAKKLSLAAKIAIWLGSALLTVGVLSLGDGRLPGILPFFFGFIAGVFALLVTMWVHSRSLYAKTIARMNQSQDQTFAVVVDKSGILSETGTTSMRFGWPGIEWVDETDAHYIMWPNQIYGLVLPKRVFRDADEGGRFAQALKDWSGGK